MWALFSRVPCLHRFWSAQFSASGKLTRHFKNVCRDQEAQPSPGAAAGRGAAGGSAGAQGTHIQRGSQPTAGLCRPFQSGKAPFLLPYLLYFLCWGPRWEWSCSLQSGIAAHILTAWICGLHILLVGHVMDRCWSSAKKSACNCWCCCVKMPACNSRGTCRQVHHASLIAYQSRGQAHAAAPLTQLLLSHST